MRTEEREAREERGYAQIAERAQAPLLARIAELEAALREIYAAGDASTGTEDWSDRVSAAMTDDIRALISDGGSDA